jgi:mevalonate kinase
LSSNLIALKNTTDIDKAKTTNTGKNTKQHTFFKFHFSPNNFHHISFNGVNKKIIGEITIYIHKNAALTTRITAKVIRGTNKANKNINLSNVSINIKSQLPCQKVANCPIFSKLP